MSNKVKLTKLVTLLVLVALVATGGVFATRAQEKIKIGMSTLNLANPFFVALTAGAKEEADKLGVELVVTDSKDDANKQVSDLENFKAAGFKGFIVTAVDPAAIGPVAKDALDKGMFVVAHTSDLGEKNQSALVWAVERDMGLTLGRQAGEWATKNIPADKTLKVAVLNFDTIPQVIQRREGIVDGIKEVFKGKVEVVGTATAGDPPAGLKAAETWLQAYPDLNMIVGINDGGALGAYQAVIAAKKNDPKTFFVGGIDATAEALAAIKEGGSYQATVDQQPKQMGALCVRTLINAIQGKPYDKVTAIKLAPVNASNVDQFLNKGQAQATAAPTAAATMAATQAAAANTPDPLAGANFKGVKIGMSTLNLANPFFVALTAGAKEEADKLGIELVVTDSKDDANKQVSDLENFKAGGFKGFIVTAVDPAAIAPVAKDALDKGMFVVAHTSDLGEKNQSALVWAVERDMGLTLGRQAGEWATKNIPADKTLKVAVLNFDTIPQVIQRREGIVDGIKEVFKGKVEVVGTATAGDPPAGLKAAETWLQAYPDLNMIVGINDGGALGAYQAVIAAKKNDPKTFFVGGIDATAEALAAIKEGGSYQATVDQQPKQMGALCVRNLALAILGKPYDKVTAIKLAPVNASNVDQFMKK